MTETSHERQTGKWKRECEEVFQALRGTTLDITQRQAYFARHRAKLPVAEKLGRREEILALIPLEEIIGKTKGRKNKIRTSYVILYFHRLELVEWGLEKTKTRILHRDRGPFEASLFSEAIKPCIGGEVRKIPLPTQIQTLYRPSSKDKIWLNLARTKDIISQPDGTCIIKMEGNFQFHVSVKQSTLDSTLERAGLCTAAVKSEFWDNAGEFGKMPIGPYVLPNPHPAHENALKKMSYDKITKEPWSIQIAYRNLYSEKNHGKLNAFLDEEHSISAEKKQQIKCLCQTGEKKTRNRNGKAKK